MSLSRCRTALCKLSMAFFVLMAPGIARSAITVYLSPPGVQVSSVAGLTEAFNGSTGPITSGSFAVGTYSASSAASISAANIYGGACSTASLTDTETTACSGGTKTNFLDIPTNLTIALASPSRYVGFWWSAVDAGTVDLLDANDKVVATLSANSQILGSDNVVTVGGSTYASGRYFGNPTTPSPNRENPGEPYAYVNVIVGSNSSPIAKIRFQASGVGESRFEIDNLTIAAAAPAPDNSWVKAGEFFDIGGTVTGLGVGKTLELTIDVAEPGTPPELLIVTSNGPFKFPRGVTFFYAVSVKTQPVGQVCNVANRSGIAEADVSNIAVTCRDASNITRTITENSLKFSSSPQALCAFPTGRRAFSTVTFRPNTSGEHGLVTTELTEMGGDNVVALYEGVFNPANPRAGQLACNDDQSGPNIRLAGLSADLVSSKVYSLLVTAYSPTDDCGYRSPLPTDVVGLPGAVTSLALGSTHTCAGLAGGAAQCWGRNSLGQLGDPTPGLSRVPNPVTGLPSGVASISAGLYHTCAVLTSGAATCWGSNESGQLGDSSVENRLTPVFVSGLGSGVKAIAAGGRHSCALMANGAAQCWGANVDGQVGAANPGGQGQYRSPVAVAGLSSGVTAIAAGDAHTCALLSGGAVKCWGSNEFGQLGDNSTTTRFGPVDVAGLASGVTAIATGYAHTCALLTGGAVKCWGQNTTGQLGDSSVENRLTPVFVSGLGSGVKAIATGKSHTCALMVSGAVQCWGSNDYGQLGSATGLRLEPFAVSDLPSGVAAIAAGEVHTCALLTGGAVKCWGANDFGELGDGSSGTCEAQYWTGTATLAFAPQVTILASVNGNASGIGPGRAVVLQNNAGDDLVVSANGAFAFPTALAIGANYAVSVKTQPAGQTCSVGNAAGTAAGDVTNVTVSCAPSPPGPPTNVRVNPTGGGAVVVSFTAPDSNGGGSITSYTVRCTSFDGGTSVSASGTSSPITVTGLTDDKTYICIVTATNSGGSGAVSVASPFFATQPNGDLRTIPTLSEWMALLLAALIGIAGYGGLRRKRYY